MKGDKVMQYDKIKTFSTVWYETIWDDGTIEYKKDNTMQDGTRWGSTIYYTKLEKTW